MKRFISLLSLALILLSSTQCHALATNRGANLIQNTCEQTDYYDFCVKSLQSESRSFNADVKGLVRIVLEQDLVKANNTLYLVGNLFNQTSDPALYRFYGTCIEEYVKATETRIPQAIGALDTGDYKSSAENATETSACATTCQEQFGSGVLPPKSPLPYYNSAVHDLSLIAASIINSLG